MSQFLLHTRSKLLILVFSYFVGLLYFVLTHTTIVGCETDGKAITIPFSATTQTSIEHNYKRTIKSHIVQHVWLNIAGDDVITALFHNGQSYSLEALKKQYSITYLYLSEI